MCKNMPCPADDTVCEGFDPRAFVPVLRFPNPLCTKRNGMYVLEERGGEQKIDECDVENIGTLDIVAIIRSLYSDRGGGQESGERGRR